MVNEDEHSEVEMRCRTQQGANAWGKVEGVMLDRNILKKLKRKVLRAFVEICDATKQFNRKIGEKQGEMGRPHGKDGCRHTSEENGRER